MRHFFSSRARAVVGMTLAVALCAGIAGIAVPVSAAPASNELAALSQAVDSLWRLLNSLKMQIGRVSPAAGGLAQVSSSCSASLITLLGSDCHYMYTNSSGQSIYCNGPMTQSAKVGDTAVTQGCSSYSGTTTTGSFSLNAATNLSASQSGGNIILSWTDNSYEETYTVEKRTSGGSWTQRDSFTAQGGAGSYQDTGGANAAGTYEYRVKPCGGGTCGTESNVATITIGSSSTSSSQTTTTTTTTTTGTTGTASGGAGLTATVSGSDVTLSWTDFYAGEDIYRVERRIGTGSWIETGITPYLAGGSGAYKDAGVGTGTYDYHVRPCSNTSGCFGESNTVRVTVGGSSTSGTAPTTATPPPVIANISVYEISTYGARITWTTDIPATSKVEYGVGSANQVVSHASFVTGHSVYIGGLTASTTYTYNVISENQDYYRTTFSNQRFTTLAGASAYVLNAPTGLAARLDANGYDVMLTWTDNSYEDSYTVERRRPPESWVVLTSSMPSQAGVGSYSDRSIPAGQYGAYEYRVKACGGGACSPESNIAAVTTSGSTSSSACETALTALLGTGCHYMFSDSAGTAVYCDGPMTKSAKRGDTVTTVGCAGSPGSTVQCADGRDNDSDGATDYPADSSCYGPDDNDEWYPTSGGTTGSTTPSGIPAAPTNLSATQTGPSVMLAWDDNATNENEYNVEWYNGTAWTSIKTIGIVYGGRGTFTDLSPSQRTHQYRVKACNLAGCSDSGPVSITVGILETPTLISLTPASGPIGTKIIITGSGFAPTGNRVHFGGGVILNLVSSDGKTIGFTVPQDQVPLCAQQDPRCLLPAPYGPVKPGTYWVSVSNASGGAGGLPFAVTENMASVFAVDPSRSSPGTGASGIETGARVRVAFTREFDLGFTGKGEFFRLSKTGVADHRVAGSFSIFPDGFEFLPSEPLDPRTSYTYIVFSSLRDRAGNALTASYTSTFTTGGASVTIGTLTGKTTDADGALLPGSYIHVYSPYAPVPYASAVGSSPYPYRDYFSRYAETDKDGSFQMSMPPGTYVLEAYPPHGRDDLSRAASRKVTIVAGETKTENIVFRSAIKIITGTVRLEDGTPVADAEVAAYATETRQWKNTSTDAAGSYTLKVGMGSWMVGVYPRDEKTAKWRWYGKPQPARFGRTDAAETITRNFSAAAEDATLTISAVDEAGVPIANAGIIADTYSGASAKSEGSPPQFRITGRDGTVVFSLRAGTYYLRGYVPQDRAYFNPDEQSITLAGSVARDLKLVFKKKQTARSLTIRGTVKTDEGVPVDAFIWAWSERGGSATTRADAGGAFSLTVLPDTRWHMGAGKEYKGLPYKSAELVVDVKQDAVVLDLVLAKHALVPLPSAVSITGTVAQQVVAQATDGAAIVVPPGASGTTGSVQVEIKPTIEAPVQAGTDVVSTVYDVTIHDAAGNPVTALKDEAQITIPYDEAELKAQGVTEDAIVPSYFDEKAGAWVHLEGCTIDTERNVAVCAVDHLTRFAITARADNVPPEAPSGSTAKAAGSGVVALTWKNPAKDF
ncbi:MAG: Ig-like domain-containing protein, partial [Patescibacteria group bacterium]